MDIEGDISIRPGVVGATLSTAKRRITRDGAEMFAPTQITPAAPSAAFRISAGEARGAHRMRTISEILAPIIARAMACTAADTARQ